MARETSQRTSTTFLLSSSSSFRGPRVAVPVSVLVIRTSGEVRYPRLRSHLRVLTGATDHPPPLVWPESVANGCNRRYMMALQRM